ALNQDLPELLLAALGNHLEVRHQCGARREDEALPVYRALGLPAQVTEFIDDMAEAYAWADLVVCRAGALTVAEVAAAGVAALFVPQQDMNAGALARSLAGLTERDALAQIAGRARQLAVPDSARRV
ncbi:UDP-N-acetylglucosamine--N-acetylmuramyl-(pentapeptide) pyrophosphoryl-undecaprenol N-acetylglucosamine transferase, partial [Vibrio agarivorans]